MAVLRLHREWPGPKGMMKPGDYAIPAEISRIHAKCARIDGAGEIVQAATFPGRADIDAERPPENRMLDGAPDAKSGGGEPDDAGGAAPAEGDAGGDAGEGDAAALAADRGRGERPVADGKRRQKGR